MEQIRISQLRQQAKGEAGGVHACRARALMVVLEKHHGEQGFEDSEGPAFPGSWGHCRWKARQMRANRSCLLEAGGDA